MTRGDILEKTIYYHKKHDNLCLEWATGLGKTKASLSCCKNYGGKWLIVLAESNHIKNWNDDIVKHGFEDLLMSIEFVLYASLHKHIGLSYDGIILDECHHLSEARADSLNNITFKKSVLLSATIDQDNKFRLDTVFKNLYTHKVSLKQAISWGILPTPKIHLIPLKLDSFNEDQELIINKGLKSRRGNTYAKYKNRWAELKKSAHISLHLSCTQQEKYDYFCEQMEYWKGRFFQTRTEAFKVKWLLNGTERKRYLSSLKTKATGVLVGRLKGSRYICFTGSVSQCEELGGKNIVHSKLKNNQQTIDKFNNHSIDSLFAVGMLKEGVNLSEANVIIVQLDSGTRSTIQGIGRSLRHANPEIYILYFKNTQDEVYLNNSLEEFKDYVI